MKVDFFSKDIIDTYIHSLRKCSTHEEKLRKSQYIVDWLDWLKEKRLVTEEDYKGALSRLNKELSLRDRFVSLQFRNLLFSKRILFICSIFLLICMGGYAYKYYPAGKESNIIPYENYSNSTLPYKGKLLDEKGLPITTKTDITFRIYDSPSLGQPLYIGTCRGVNGITPDYSGNFTIVLGSHCDMPALPKILFERRTDLYLGVQMGNNLELTPRQKILTSAYSSDAARLQGLPVGIDKGSIPFINKLGQVIFKHEDPSIKTLNGIFTIESPEISIKTTGNDNASILFQPSSAGNTIVSNGKFGIGTSTPVSAITAQAIEPYSAIGTLTNLAPEDNDALSVLNLNLATSSTGTESRYIQFFASTTEDDTGVLVGSIRLNNEGVAYETAGADFAEYFETSYPSLESGYIMTISPEGIHKSKKGERIIGVTTDIAGFVGNKRSTNKNNTLIGIEGQVNVYVLNVGGEIRKGDVVGLSEIEGYGQKQTEENNMVGIALENSGEKEKKDCPENVRAMLSSNIICTKIRVLLK